MQTTRVPLMLAAALVLGLGVELLRRQTAREIPDPPPPDLGGSVRRGMGRVRGRTAEQDRLAALERLGRLREQGVLTDEEFAAEKAQLVRHSALRPTITSPRKTLSATAVTVPVRSSCSTVA